MASWAVRSLAYHKTRSILTVLGISLATALLTSSLSFLSGYRQALQRNIDAMGYQILVTGKGCPHEAATLILRGGSIPMYIQEPLYRRIAADPDVKDSTRFLMQTVPDARAGAHQLYVGIDQDFLTLKPDVTFQRGGWFSSEYADEAILGYNVAEYRRLGLGDRIEVQGREVVVCGVLDRLGTQDDGTVFLPLALCQSLFEKRDRLTGAGIRLKDMGRAAEFIERMYDLPSVQVVRMSQVQTTILGILDGIRALLIAFGGLCLFIALMGVLNVSLINLNERLPEMGVLRAMGFSAGTIFQLVWSETLLMSACGAGAGTILALGLRGAAESAARSVLAFVPGGEIIEVTIPAAAGSALLVVALSMLAGIYPAWKATSVPPMTVIRGAA